MFKKLLDFKVKHINYVWYNKFDEKYYSTVYNDCTHVILTKEEYDEAENALKEYDRIINILDGYLKPNENSTDYEKKIFELLNK